MPYDAANDPYIDTTTGILINKLDIADAHSLEQAEAEITAAIIASVQLPANIKQADFTKGLFLELHREIFGNIYEWAGSLRSIDISKGDSYFAHSAYIDASLDTLFSELTADTKLQSREKDVFVSAITHYHSELNAIHPFREGNGRLIRTFLGLVAENSGWFVDWSNIDPASNITASIQAFKGDCTLLLSMMSSITSPNI
ncbi:MAG: Fic family protein [Candidatus Saccharimonas sp.]